MIWFITIKGRQLHENLSYTEESEVRKWLKRNYSREFTEHEIINAKIRPGHPYLRK